MPREGSHTNPTWQRALVFLVDGIVAGGVLFAGLFAFERESAVLDAVRAWFLLTRTKADTRERLRRRRSELADVLDEVNTWLIEQSEIAEC